MIINYGKFIINLNSKTKKKEVEEKIDKTGFVYISGFENLYMINKEGKIISCSKVAGSVTLKDRYMKPYKKSNGYYQIDLKKDGFRKKYYVHRLVAETFIPNPNKFPFVNHKDENKTNNCVENLEWCNATYNNRYSNIYNNLRELRGDKIKITNIKNNEVVIYNSKNEAAFYIKGSNVGINNSIKRGTIYKSKYKIEIISYGKR